MTNVSVAFFLFNYSQNIFITGTKHLKKPGGQAKIPGVMKETDFEDFAARLVFADCLS